VRLRLILTSLMRFYFTPCIAVASGLNQPLVDVRLFARDLSAHCPLDSL